MAEDELSPIGTVIAGVVALGIAALCLDAAYGDEHRIAAAGVCVNQDARACLRREPGMVEVSDSGATTLLYDDGRRRARVVLAGDVLFEPGTRVWLERWDGDVVAVYDRRTERRHRTLLWPNGDNSGWWVVVLWGGALLAFGGFGVFRLLGSWAARQRDRTAARAARGAARSRGDRES